MDSGEIRVFDNRSPVKCQSEVWHFVVQKWCFTFLWVMPKTAQTFSWHVAAFAVSNAWCPLPQFGKMKTVFSEVSKSQGIATSIFGGAASGFS